MSKRLKWNFKNLIWILKECLELVLKYLVWLGKGSRGLRESPSRKRTQRVLVRSESRIFCKGSYPCVIHDDILELIVIDLNLWFGAYLCDYFDCWIMYWSNCLMLLRRWFMYWLWYFIDIVMLNMCVGFREWGAK